MSTYSKDCRICKTEKDELEAKVKSLELSDELLDQANDELEHYREENWDQTYEIAFLREDLTDINKILTDAFERAKQTPQPQDMKTRLTLTFDEYQGLQQALRFIRKLNEEKAVQIPRSDEQKQAPCTPNDTPKCIPPQPKMGLPCPLCREIIYDGETIRLAGNVWVHSGHSNNEIAEFLNKSPANRVRKLLEKGKAKENITQ
jgi:hypothetical protein